MESEYAVVVDPAILDNPFTGNTVGFGYWARVERGTIHRYHPGSGPKKWRPSARWAKAAGDRWIRREHAREAREQRRERMARIATGYEENRP